MVEHRVQRHLQRPDLTLELGEQEAALERGERCEGEVVRVAVEFAARMQRGAATMRSITDTGGRARFVAADLTDPAAVRQLAEEAGDVDILVNNAAIFPGAPTVSQDADTLDVALAANIRAPYLLTAALNPAMIANGSGSIVNVRTMAARIGMPGLSVYSATKAALESLTRT